MFVHRVPRVLCYSDLGQGESREVLRTVHVKEG